ncbi:hypothetical protein DLAC_01642 [Tieghemostelium lacteum]|uniref:F-box domain-containing protein n=1 Tax=Tieghemostelium lacteum TaxID=361077 RepID=A0A152A5X5_TIELA|nr:hypothetical protein DLAC_01642 [Tieghemostelium lacteum]|eukprot:KYR01639.1 hypothetical protein DLAC_01642 [Tieghemostelium lacteum]
MDNIVIPKYLVIKILNYIPKFMYGNRAYYHKFIQGISLVCKDWYGLISNLRGYLIYVETAKDYKQYQTINNDIGYRFDVTLNNDTIDLYNRGPSDLDQHTESIYIHEIDYKRYPIIRNSPKLYQMVINHLVNENEPKEIEAIQKLISTKNTVRNIELLYITVNPQGSQVRHRKLNIAKDLSNLENLEKLMDFQLLASYLEVSGLEYLARLPILTVINLRTITTTVESFQQLMEYSYSLKEVTLERVTLLGYQEDDVMAILNLSKLLKKVSLTFSSYRLERFINYINNCRSLETVRIDGAVDSQGFNGGITNSTIHSVYMNTDSKLTYRPLIFHWSTQSALREIASSELPTSQYIKDYHPHCNTLKYSELNHQENFKNLCDIIELPQIHSVQIGYKFSGSVQTLLSSMALNYNLYDINLDFPIDFASICNLITFNQASLKNLSFSYCRGWDIKTFVYSLQQNHHLNKIWIANVQITNQGRESMKDYLQEVCNIINNNPTINHLKLASPSYSPKLTQPLLSQFETTIKNNIERLYSLRIVSQNTPQIKSILNNYQIQN